MDSNISGHLADICKYAGKWSSLRLLLLTTYILSFYSFGEVLRGGNGRVMGKTGKWEGEEREGRKVMGAEIEGDRDTRK